MPTDPAQSAPTSVRIVRVLLYLLMLTPAVVWPSFFYFFTSSKLFYVLGLSQVLFIVIVWVWARYKPWRPRRSWIVLSVVVYILILTVSALLGVDPFMSFWGGPERAVNMISLLHLLLVFLAMVSVLREEKDWKRLILVSVLVSVIVSVVHVYTLMTRDVSETYLLWHGGSLLGNSGFLGTYLIFHIAFAGLLVVRAASRRERVWMIATVVFLSLTLLSTEARAAILAFVGGAAFFASLVLLGARRRMMRVGGGILLAALVLGAVFVVASLFSPQSSVREYIVDRSSETRFILWDMAWEGFKERPLLGWGPENFSNIFQTYFNPCLGSVACGGEVWFDRAHNKLFDIFAETGIVGLLGYLSILVAAGWGIWRGVQSKRYSRIEASVFVALVAAYLVQGMMIFDTLTSYLSLLIVLGYIHATSVSSQKFSTYSSKYTPWILLVVVPVAGSLFYFTTFLPAKSSLSTTKVFQSVTLSEHQEAVQTALHIPQSYGIDMRRSVLAAKVATLILDTDAQNQKQYADQFLSELVLVEQGLLDSIERSPLFLRGYLDLVLVYQVWGIVFDEEKTQKAFEMAQRAVDQFPKNPLAYWSGVSLLLQEGHIEEAQQLAQVAVNLDPRVQASMMRSLITVLFTKNTDHIQRVAQQIVSLDPSMQSLVEGYIGTDPDEKRLELLFRFYYDAAF